MNCINCGGALPADSGVCEYCGTLNDLDLRGVFDVAQRTSDHSRHCPRCGAILESLELGLKKPLQLDRCPRCLGLFFDPGELDAVVKARTTPSQPIDMSRLAQLIEEETPITPSDVKYAPCPACGELMNRHSYGVRSGVIYNQCKEHGIWLDGGELRRILKWVRAGGPALNAERAAAREEAEQRAYLEKTITHGLDIYPRHLSPFDYRSDFIAGIARLLAHFLTKRS